MYMTLGDLLLHMHENMRSYETFNWFC